MEEEGAQPPQDQDEGPWFGVPKRWDDPFLVRRRLYFQRLYFQPGSARLESTVFEKSVFRTLEKASFGGARPEVLRPDVFRRRPV